MTKILKNYKLIFVCIIFCFFAVCVQFFVQELIASAYSNLATTNIEQDNDIFKYYHKPTIEEDFEGDIVNLILNKGFIGKVGFDEFKFVNDISEISEITYKSETIYRGSKKKFIVSEEDSAILILKLSVNEKENVLKIIEQLQISDMILIAEPEYIYETVSDVIPSDAHYNMQWALHDDNGIKIEDAWNLTISDSVVKVGLFENGGDDKHPDLLGNIYDGNYPGFSEDIHGTHVAGIIGAKQDSYGISGVSKCSMYTLSRSSFVTSLRYAIDNGIKIINASFHFTNNGMNNYEPFNASHFQAIKEYDGILICSAGNDNYNIENNPMYPACYDLPNVISVGSIDGTGTKSYFSNYGKFSVSLFAPGGNILSTFPQSLCTGEFKQTSFGKLLACECKWSPTEAKWIPNGTTHYENGYHYMSGTSMAAPHVTGVAALLMSMDNKLTPTQIKTIICNSVDKDEHLSDLCVTGGRLNAYKALLQLADKDENGYYFEEFDYQNFSMYHNIELNTICCRPDGSYEVMDNEQGILGGFNGMSVSLCEMTGKKINFSEWTFFESELVIYTQGIVNSGCYVYGDNGNYLDECTFSMDEGALHVPLKELFNRNLSSFLLIPGYAEESGGLSGTYTVGFSPSDVYLNLFARKYV